MSENVQNVKSQLENIFNVPAKIAKEAVKVNVKKVSPESFLKLALIELVEISIKRSGTGLAVIVKPF